MNWRKWQSTRQLFGGDVKHSLPEGATVEIFHYRRYFDPWTGRFANELRCFADPRQILQARGGMTVARVTSPHKLLASASARCSKHDNYCKKIGRDIAVGRALKKLERG